MKRGTPRHPKMMDFVQKLDQRPRSLAAAVGYLELLWHFTAEFAPQGDIGKYSDDQIEAAMDWSGKRGRLLQALSDSGWIDECGVSRLLVHDWHDHSDDAVRKRLQRSGLQFLAVTEKVTGQRQTLSGTLPENGCLPEPLPVPKPEPSHTGAADAAGVVVISKPRKSGKRTTEEIIRALGPRLAWWKEFWEPYPCKDGMNPAMDAFERRVTTLEIFTAVMVGVKAYAAKARSNPDMKLKYAQGWINDERWTDSTTDARASPYRSGEPESRRLMFTDEPSYAVTLRKLKAQQAQQQAAE